jgi:hypothetical protein
MDKIGYFQSIYEAQFALGKKTGACLSAQYLALEAFLQRNPEWHYHWWPIVGITSKAWSTLQTRASSQSSNRVISSQGLIRAHLYDRVKRGRALFERDVPLPDAWHFYETRDATVLAATEERNAVTQLPWLPLNPEVLGQQGTGVPVITRKRFNALRNALSLLATPESAI